MISGQSTNMDTLQHLQIELTSRCNMMCISCIRPSYHRQWQAEDLSDTVIDRIIKSNLCSSVHLQGWGESLLRPDLPEIINKFKKRQCLVSLSSNGSIMSPKLAGMLIEVGVDSMAFSLAGADRKNHDAIRGRGSFSKAIESIVLFLAQQKRDYPPVVINYLLTPANLRDLPKMIRLCGRLGVKHLVTTHLVHICTTAQKQMAAYTNSAKYRRSIIFGNAMAPLYGVTLSLPPMKMREHPVCGKSPLNSLYVAFDGSVSPCVFLCPPLLGKYSQRVEGEWQEKSRVIFGNLHEKSLSEIWSSKPYAAFRQAFRKRNDIYTSKIKPVKSDFEGMEKLLNAVEKVSQLLQAHRPPSPCTGCPRLFGM